MHRDNRGNTRGSEMHLTNTISSLPDKTVAFTFAAPERECDTKCNYHHYANQKDDKIHCIEDERMEQRNDKNCEHLFFTKVLLLVLVVPVTSREKSPHPGA